jgi:hypothetical protein
MSRAQKGNVNDLYLMFVVVTVIFAAMWHNQPPQSGRKAADGKPDPAVLFSRKNEISGKQTMTDQVQPTVKKPQAKQPVKD